MGFGDVTKRGKTGHPIKRMNDLGLFACKQTQALVMPALIESWGFSIGIGMY